MIKIIIFLCSLCLPYCLLAQIHAPDACGSVLGHDGYEHYKQQVQQNKRLTNSNSNSRSGNVTLKLQPHIIRRSDGTGGLTLSELQTSIQQLNNAFAPVGFDFEYCTPNYIDNDAFNSIEYLPRFANSQEYLMANANRVNDAMNIFFVDSAYITYLGQNNITLGAKINWSSFPFQMDTTSLSRDWIIMNNSFSNDNETLAHEVGHYFDLLHTHTSGLEGDYDGITLDPENVTRNSSDPCYNCDTAGDLLCDTPADPVLDTVTDINSGRMRNITAAPNCQYIGVSMDNCSPSQAYQPDTRNIMSYGYGCRLTFSLGQIARMWTALTQYRTNLANACSACPASLSITQDVLNGQSDVQSASSTLTATNSIFNGGSGIYSAGNEVVLRPGFEAKMGADFDGIIRDCSQVAARTTSSNPTAPSTVSERTTTASKLELSTGEISMTIFPNPARDQFELKFSSLTDRKFVNITLVNLQGQTVKETLRQEDFPKGDYNVSISTNDLPSGVYFVRLLTDKENMVKRLVVLEK